MFDQGKSLSVFLKIFTWLPTGLVICLYLCSSKHTSFLSIYWVYQACRPSRSFVPDFPFPELSSPTYSCFPFLLLQDLYFSITCLRLTQSKITKALHTIRLLPFICLFALTLRNYKDHIMYAHVIHIYYVCIGFPYFLFHLHDLFLRVGIGALKFVCVILALRPVLRTV